MSAAHPKPNVLFILADQHNAKCLGHKGHPDVLTPNLDRLAAEGVRFDNALCQNPICTPSRVSFLSGQYCHNHGYYGLCGPKPAGLPTVLGWFRRAGYATAAIGKIHCPADWVEDDCDLFHETGTGTSVGGRSPDYTRYLQERNVEHLEDHGALTEFGAAGTQKLDGRPSAISYEDSREGWAARMASEFIARCAAQATPFFAHVSMAKPHQCYTPAKRFWDLYDGSKLTLPPNLEHPMKDHAPHARLAAERFRRADWALFDPKTVDAARRRKLHGYLGNTTHVDFAVGELLDALRRAGLQRDTIVVYSSDHGDYACEQGLMEKAPGICHDAITRIPFLWRWPERFKAGHCAAEIVESVDLVPTLCALAGLDPLATADGKDLSRLLRGEAANVRRIGVTEFPWSKSVRNTRFRLVWYPPEMFASEYPGGFGELYDLERDPWEMENLYFKPEFAAVVRDLRDELLNWLVTTARPRTAQGVNPLRPDQAVERYKCRAYADGTLSPEDVRSALASGRRNYL
jgi:arylsulfatase A-like enzyme